MPKNKSQELPLRDQGNSDQNNIAKVKNLAIQDTLAQSKENNELIKFVMEKLDYMMIEYNKGLIIQMSIKEKQQLK